MSTNNFILILISLLIVSREHCIVYKIKNTKFKNNQIAAVNTSKSNKSILFPLQNKSIQNSAVKTDKTKIAETIINTLLSTEQALKNDSLIVHNRLYELYTNDFKNVINKYNLEIDKKGIIIAEIIVPLISDKQLSIYKKYADSCYRNLDSILDFERKEYDYIFNKFGKVYCHFSKPLFSKNGEYALIEYECITNVILDHHSVAYIMKKKGRKWVIYDIVRIIDS